MIAPYKHTGNLSDLDSNTKLEIVDLIQNSIDIIKKSMGADSFNIGVNIGDIAGAGVKDHFHVHIVPRWIGDTNFMPIIGETKVISEGLRQTWEKLHKEFLNITANKL
jgi:ATP adenylyltransferase